MSKFLAPIHSWLFNKIKISEMLEKDIVEAFDKKYGNASIIYEEIVNNLGHPTEDLPLEDIIDKSNIHGWLQEKISLTEKRTAALVTKLILKFGEDSKSIIIDAFKAQGEICGKEVKEDSFLESPRDLFKAVNNYILEGMPCDNVNSVSEDTEDKIQWVTSKCLHKKYWDLVNGDINTFYILRNAWIKSFVEAINPMFLYNRIIEDNNGNCTFINSIYKNNI
ncbi:hypothetical protein [Clostridium algidicarnis]|uniref:hypothetical protein n=1 Tax=Clostridium algidicarnis TaxID=37659 RepID=UPI001C0CF087|nr:hypothetical protein [Clostridium algidicarnis]MBU3195181.1 hypothetical protein [Clostridium algidicarnis]MBU3208137.1 hypothetical protein [Clostridium algidicarnis]MBU3227632.1 hypothetical protein [Clostridium algidicarnis]MBU3250961.1 hypothetical protein [Clostridium algidicarnis]